MNKIILPDSQADDEMKLLSETLSRAMLIVFNGLQAANAAHDNLRSTCAALLLNSAHSIVGAVELIRHGYRLQPALLLRSVIETLCTVMHLKVHPTDLANLERGPLNPNKTVHTARQVLPVFKSLYKLFSQEFGHIGTAHRFLHLLVPYEENDALLRLNLSILRLPTWLVACTTELTFLDLVSTPRYWMQVDADRYRFAPSAEEKARIAEFVKIREE